MFSTAFCFEGENPFDILAELIARLLALPRDYANARAFYHSDIFQGMLLESVNAFVKEHPAFLGGESILYSGIPQREAEAVRQWKYADNAYALLEVIKGLDRGLDVTDIFESEYLKSIEKDGFEALNDNAFQTGCYILPRLKSINDFAASAGTDLLPRRYEDSNKPDINLALVNTYVIRAEELQVDDRSCKMLHHILRGAYTELELPLLIAASPLVKADLLCTRQFSTQEKNGGCQSGFAVEGLKDAGLVKTKLQAAFRRAVEAQAHILLFPEMLGCAEFTRPEFFDRLRNSVAGDNPLPWLTLLPTWWHDRSNELYVLDGSGRIVCVQRKVNPYPFEEDGVQYYEDLDKQTPVVHVVHIQGLGRLTFPICIDLLTPSYQRLLVEVIKSTFLLCPSYSPHKTMFSMSAVKPVSAGAYTVWLNTCAAYAKSGAKSCYIGIVSGPMEDNDRVRLEPKCGYCCGAAEEPCVFFITLQMGQFPVVDQGHNRVPGIHAL